MTEVSNFFLPNLRFDHRILINRVFFWQRRAVLQDSIFVRKPFNKQLSLYKKLEDFLQLESGGKSIHNGNFVPLSFSNDIMIPKIV